jgi:hypothetical protein
MNRLFPAVLRERLGNPDTRMEEGRGSMRTFRRLLSLAVLAALALCVTAAARNAAPKTVVRIDLKGHPQGGNPTGGGGTFTLHSGSAADKGASSYSFSISGSTTKGTLTLDGSKGSLTLRTTSRPSGLNVDSQGLDLWLGTWSIVDGDGAYKGAHGVGAYIGIIGPSYAVALHLEGFRSS